MDKKTWGFISTVLFVALALSSFISPFASKKPDGLDKFAEEQKFAEQTEGKDAWRTHAPLPDYKLNGIEHEGVSTAVAGVIGTLVVFGLAFGLAKVLSRKNPSGPERKPGPVNHAFLNEHAGLNSPIHRLDARLKIIVTLCFVVIAVSTPIQARLAFAGYALFLLSVLLLARVPARHVLKRLAGVLPFIGVVVVFLPFLPSGATAGLAVFWNALSKSLLGAMAAILLAATTPFPKLLAGLAELHTPRLLILIISFAYRYLFLLVDETQRMKRAADSRLFAGRWLWQSAVLGRLLGTLFLRSYERGERVYLAMVARGFNGSLPRPKASALRLTDCLCVCGATCFLLALRLCAI